MNKHALTARQKQYLELLAEMQQNGGVHYSLIASRLRVSHWTAYDMLTRLARVGLVSAVPAVSNCSPSRSIGRSRILFTLTPTGNAMIGGISSDELHLLEERFQEALSCHSQGQFAIAFRKRLAELPGHKSPFLFCSSMTLLFILCLRTLARSSDPLATIGHFANVMGSSQHLLLSISGAAMALLLLRGPSSQLLPILSAWLPEYERKLGSLGELERESLLGFVRRALRQIVAEGSRPAHST